MLLMNSHADRNTSLNPFAEVLFICKYYYLLFINIVAYELVLVIPPTMLTKV